MEEEPRPATAGAAGGSYRRRHQRYAAAQAADLSAAGHFFGRSQVAVKSVTGGAAQRSEDPGATDARMSLVDPCWYQFPPVKPDGSEARCARRCF